MSNFFSEILQSLKKTSTERISNPFYGVLIITWLAFNWEAVAILLFSDLKMEERVRFINSAYSLMHLYPFVTAIMLTFLLPWCTEKITYFQSRPIGRTSTLLALRKKKMLIADISVERFRAKKDVAYDRHKVGAEKEVQDMREDIIKSKETTGQLTQELIESKELSSSLYAKIEVSDKENNRLQKLILDYSDKLRDNENKIRTLDEILKVNEKLTKKTQRLESDLAIKSEKVDELEQLNSQSKTHIENIAVSNKSLTERLNEMQTQYSSENAGLANVIETLHHDFKTYRNLINNLAQEGVILKSEQLTQDKIAARSYMEQLHSLNIKYR
ncbi:hypothetical protein [Pantoea ananatis]